MTPKQEAIFLTCGIGLTAVVAICGIVLFVSVAIESRDRALEPPNSRPVTPMIRADRLTAKRTPPHEQIEPTITSRHWGRVQGCNLSEFTHEGETYLVVQSAYGLAIIRHESKDEQVNASP